MKTIQLLLLSFLYLYGNYALKTDYIFSNPIITAKTLFPNIEQDIFIYKAPKNRFTFFLNSNQIIEKLRKYGIEINKNGVRRVKFTYLSEEISLEEISDEIYDEYSQFYPSMIIDEVIVVPKHQLNKLPENYSLVFRESNLRRSKGYFYIEDERDNKIHFKYIINASLDVLKSSQTIRRGEVIDETNTYPQTIKFDRYRSSYLSEEKLSKVVAKHYIPRDRELTDRVVEKLKVIKRNQIVKGFLQDGAVYIEVEVRTLNSGGVGDFINIETSEGAKLKAKIISSKMVQIL